VTSTPTKPRAPRAGTCRRFAMRGECPKCGDMVDELHVDVSLKAYCSECCPSCAAARRRTAD
jgi:hypothetical protein